MEGVGIDVHEHRGAARVVDGAGRGEERERGTDHLVAGPEAQGLEREEDRVGAAGAGDRVPDVGQCGDALLQEAHFFAHDEGLTLDDLHHQGQHLVLDGPVLGDQVEEGDVHGAKPKGAPAEGSIRWSCPASSR